MFHLKSYRASFVSYKTSMFSAVSSLSSWFVPPNFLTPDQVAAIVEDLTAEEIRRGTKLTPAIQVGFEATYYEVQIVLEITFLQEGLSIVLGYTDELKIVHFRCLSHHSFASTQRGWHDSFGLSFISWVRGHRYW